MTDDDLVSAARQFHDDVPHQFQVSLTMSIDTREQLRAITSELNDHVGEHLFTTNDAMQLALVAAARYNEVATGEVDELTELDESELIPLTRIVRSALDEDLDGG